MKKKKSRFATIEEEALETWIIKKKAEDMEDELRRFISATYGPSAWQEIIRMQAQIRKDRLEAQELLKKQREEMIAWVAVSLTIAGGIALLVYFIWLLKNTGI